MAAVSHLLHLSSTFPSTSISPHSSFPTRLQSLSLGIHTTVPQSFQIHVPVIVHKKGALMAMGSADPDEPASAGEDGDSTDEEERFGIQNMPLEAKLQLKLEHKMKLKIRKTVRLRRKRLMRKRMMRKKAKWPPSKMKKLKNV